MWLVEDCLLLSHCIEPCRPWHFYSHLVVLCWHWFHRCCWCRSRHRRRCCCLALVFYKFVHLHQVFRCWPEWLSPNTTERQRMGTQYRHWQWWSTSYAYYTKVDFDADRRQQCTATPPTWPSTKSKLCGKFVQISNETWCTRRLNTKIMFYACDSCAVQYNRTTNMEYNLSLRENRRQPNPLEWHWLASVFHVVSKPQYWLCLRYSPKCTPSNSNIHESSGICKWVEWNRKFVCKNKISIGNWCLFFAILESIRFDADPDPKLGFPIIHRL